ncbi:hypothetical protein [Sneathiella sp. HT1-7]|uniref:hypothetical protein n=1 Tax=Sneathiella sp. HT1-7 TaxID=2887192 RepID=UPI001D13B56B|nr:hypothetical protein [Sneathiella sp. HT1-7]MCC3305599.1 hypothetical protein [Sneathiella sp. HT1-7]
MRAYIVTYDLHKAGQNYECLEKKLKAYDAYFHMQGSVWIIATDSGAEDIVNNLKGCLDSNDNLFVGALTGEACWIGFNQKATDWLKKHL